MTLSGLRVMTVDPSLRSTGIYYRSPQNSFTDTISPSGGLWSACLHLEDLMQQHLGLLKPDIVLIEALAYKAPRMAQLAAVGAAVHIACMRADIPFVDIPINTWKAVAGRWPKKKKAEAEAYCEYVRANTGVNVANPDEADAVMIFHAVSMICLGHGTSKTQQSIREQISAEVEKVNSGEVI